MWYSYRELIYRVGTFFLMLGIGMVLLFMLSEAANQVMFSFFCWGTILLVIGFIFRAQYKKSLPSSGRFGIFKRLSSKSKDNKGKK
ncbi:MAG: hypothetical protein ACM3PS_08930 [Syntrophothermus sp.]